MATTAPAPRVGGIVEIHPHHAGEPARTGEILEVLGDPAHPHLRVRWDDGHVSVLYPGSDAHVR